MTANKIANAGSRSAPLYKRRDIFPNVLTTSTKKKSIDNKREICEYARQCPTLSHTDISHYFDEKFSLSIDRSTVSKILSSTFLLNILN